MRILLRSLFSGWDSRERQHFHSAIPRVASRSGSVNARYFSDLVTDSKYWIQRRHRLLKNHGDAIAANVPHTRIIERDEIFSLELDAASSFDASGLLNQPKNRERRD